MSVTSKYLFTAQNMKFSIKGFFSKCDQIRRKLFFCSVFFKMTDEDSFPEYSQNITQIFRLCLRMCVCIFVYPLKVSTVSNIEDLVALCRVLSSFF